VFGYGTPLRYEIEAVERALGLAEGRVPTEVVLLSEGDEPRSYEMPNVADVLMPDIPHRSVDTRRSLVFPAGQAVYWATFDKTLAEEQLSALTPEAIEARVPLREGRRSFRFYHWPGGEPGLPFVPVPSGGPSTWANGAALAGYTVSGDLRPGATLRWVLFWHPQRTPDEDVYYHWFNHLVDEQGRLAGQQDGPSLLPAYWRSGDTVLNWFDIEVSPDVAAETYFMRVGMYTYPSLERVPLVGADESPDWLVVGPLRDAGTTGSGTR
jgi:hypothetical protein